jgi:hypothetical protein
MLFLGQSIIIISNGSSVDHNEFELLESSKMKELGKWKGKLWKTGATNIGHIPSRQYRILNNWIIFLAIT